MPGSQLQKKLSIVTYNTFGVPFFAPNLAYRYKNIARLLDEGPYDVVCLQEVFSYYNLSLLKKGMPNFPYLLYQKNPFGPRGGLVIFSKHPLSKKAFSRFSFPKNAQIPFYTYVVQHGILSCTLEDLGIRIATTHLSSDLEHNLTQKNKLYKLIRTQLEETADQFNLLTSKYKYSFLVGDFNIAKHSELYQLFMKKTNAKDIFETSESPTYNFERFKYIYVTPHSSRVDYMFMGKNGQMHPIRTVSLLDTPISHSGGEKSYLSDHNGLHCILSFNK